MPSTFDEFLDDSIEEVSAISEERVVDGTLSVDTRIPIPSDGLRLGGPHKPRCVDENGKPLPDLDNYRLKPQARATLDAKGKPVESELMKFAMTLANRDDITEDEKVERMMQASKLARIARLTDIALNAPDKESLRALTRLRDEEDGRPSSRKPIDADEEIEGVIWEKL